MNSKYSQVKHKQVINIMPKKKLTARKTATLHVKKILKNKQEYLWKRIKGAEDTNSCLREPFAGHV